MNVLLCMYNFDAPWCRPAMEGILRAGMRVTVVPFSFDDGTDEAAFLREFGPQGEHRAAVLRPFAAYGIEDVQFVNYFSHTPAEAKAMVQAADVIFLTGGLPDRAMTRLREFDLVQPLTDFPGIVMGASAGAMMQIADYHISPDDDYPAYQRSTGLDFGLPFDVEVHYAFAKPQQDGIRRALGERPVPIWAMENESALLVRDGQVTPLGKCHLVASPEEIPLSQCASHP